MVTFLKEAFQRKKKKDRHSDPRKRNERGVVGGDVLNYYGEKLHCGKAGKKGRRLHLTKKKTENQP